MSKRISGHRRRGLPRLASVRAAAGGAATTCSASTTSSPARKQQHRAPARQSALRADAPRRDLPALCRGRRDLQPRLPGLADPLPARPGADDQDQRARRHQHAGPGQAHCAPRSSRPRPARSTAIRRCIRRPRAIGATSIRSARAPATTRASAAPRRCSSTTTASTGCDIKVARIFNTYGPRMHPNDGRVVSNFIVQALQGRGHHHLRRRQADPLLLLRRRPDRRLAAPDGPHAGRLHRAGQSRQSGRDPDQAARREGHRAGRRQVEARHARPLPVDDPLQRCPDITLARDKLKWEPKVAARAGAGEDDRVFRRPAAQQRGGQPRRALAERERSAAHDLSGPEVRAPERDCYWLLRRHRARQGVDDGGLARGHLVVDPLVGLLHAVLEADARAPSSAAS